jgi:hypothetical protein
MPMLPEVENELLEKTRTDQKQFGALFRPISPITFGHVFRKVLDYDLGKAVSTETF